MSLLRFTYSSSEDASRIEQGTRRIAGKPRRRARRGVSLLVVVVLVMLISLSAYRYTFVMESEYRLTRYQEELAQARYTALSGVEYATYLLEQPRSIRSMRLNSADRARLFRRTVTTQSSDPNAAPSRIATWQFGLVAPISDDSTRSPSSVSLGGTNLSGSDEAVAWRWGIENESAKLSIPALLRIELSRPGHFRMVLMNLPGMDEETADAWLDQLGVARPKTMASADALTPLEARGSIQQPREGSFAIVPRQERDTSKTRFQSLWCGGDLNQNYRLDPIELQWMERFSRSVSASTGPNPRVTDSSPRWQPLQRYLTWTSGERNQRNDGRPRINLNQPNLEQLRQELMAILPTEHANFVIAYRQYGPVAGSLASNPPMSTPKSNARQPSDMTLSAFEFTPALNVAARFSIRSPMDLFDAEIDVPQSQGTQANTARATGPAASKSPSNPSTRTTNKRMRSPFSSDSSDARNYLGRWLSETTVEDTAIREGRVDVSEAPVEVLMGVPGIDAMLAQRIVQQRQSLANQSKSMESIAWLLEGGVMNIGKLREIEPYLTHCSDVYSLQSIGFRDSRSPVFRCTLTIDARTKPATLLPIKVWHPWDRGFDIDALTGAPQ